MNIIMYIIRTPKGPLGCTHKGKPYIAGFNGMGMVVHVSRGLKIPPVTRLERLYEYDITEEVRDSLQGLGFRGQDLTFEKITIDTRALFTIERDVGLGMTPTDVEVDPIDPADFLYMTFEKNVGLIMPYEICVETPTGTTLRSNVVDPSYDLGAFRKGLKM